MKNSGAEGDFGSEYLEYERTIAERIHNCGKEAPKQYVGSEQVGQNVKLRGGRRRSVEE